MNPDPLSVFPLALSLIVCATSAPLPAQAPSQPVSWSIALAPPGTASVKRGGRLTVAVTAKIAEGWHIYGTDELKDGPRPLGITLPAEQPFKPAGKLQAPEPDREFDDSFNQVTTLYRQTTTFRLPATVLRDAVRGPSAVNVEIRFQACDGRICLPVRTVKLSAPVAIE